MYLLVDLGGLTDEKGLLLDEVRAKIHRELKKADLAVVLFDVKAIDGEDQRVYHTLRRESLPHIVVANKCDSDKEKMYLADIYALGCEQVLSLSCKGKKHLSDLRENIAHRLKSISPKNAPSEEAVWGEKEPGFALAVIGKPNVGKSSLLNRLLGKERSLVSLHPGTTRDAVTDFFSYKDVRIKIIDTAGMRRKNRDKEAIEEYSIKKSLSAITQCDVAPLGDRRHRRLIHPR